MNYFVHILSLSLDGRSLLVLLHAQHLCDKVFLLGFTNYSCNCHSLDGTGQIFPCSVCVCV